MKNWLTSIWHWNNREMTNQDIADTCEDAAALIEGKWTKGKWYDLDNNTYCVEGALMAALGLDYYEVDTETSDRKLLVSCPVYDAVTETLNARIAAEHEEDGEERSFYGLGELPEWNDNAVVDEQEILDLLHATAKRVLGVEA